MGLNAFRKNKEKPLYRAVQLYRFPSDYPTQVEFLRELKDARFTVEHTNPDNWGKSAECTWPECYGCEQALKQAYTGWVQKTKMYIDAMVLNAPVVIQQSLTPSSLYSKLLTYDSIRGTLFEVTKTGKGKRTKHLLEPLSDCTPTIEKINLTDYTKTIPYTQQEQYYNK